MTQNMPDFYSDLTGGGTKTKLLYKKTGLYDKNILLCLDLYRFRCRKIAVILNNVNALNFC